MRYKKFKHTKSEYFDIFMSISSSLTSFSIYDLYATGLANEYLNYIIKAEKNSKIKTFLQKCKKVFVQKRSKKWKPIRRNIPNKYVNEIIRFKLFRKKSLKLIADKIIKLWYQGTWEGKYIHENSYKEGLIWKAIHSHPPGHKQPGFGSWSIKPLTENKPKDEQ